MARDSSLRGWTPRCSNLGGSTEISPLERNAALQANSILFHLDSEPLCGDLRPFFGGPQNLA